MDLVRKRVTPLKRDYGKISRLMKRVFPESELFPIPFLLLQSCRKGIEFTAYYDENILCGISYVVKGKELVFLLYLAVDDSLQSKGYGSRILNSIKESAGDLPIALNVEPVEETASNYEQRLRRLGFYERNGFHQSGYRMKDDKEEYQILTTSDAFDPEAYREVLRYFARSSKIPCVVKD